MYFDGKFKHFRSKYLTSMYVHASNSLGRKKRKKLSMCFVCVKVMKVVQSPIMEKKILIFLNVQEMNRPLLLKNFHQQQNSF